MNIPAVEIRKDEMLHFALDGDFLVCKLSKGPLRVTVRYNGLETSPNDAAMVRNELDYAIANSPKPPMP